MSNDLNFSITPAPLTGTKIAAEKKGAEARAARDRNKI
jgi:hypothetical protein